MYVRPKIVNPVFYDDDGHVIEYGNRWENSAPQNSYFQESHAERFAPLHPIAEALLTYLSDTYDVEIVEGEKAVAEFVQPAKDFLRAVSVRPRDASSVSLTFVFTAGPAVIVQIGSLNTFYYPSCSCDGCDSTWYEEAEELEALVHAVVHGNYCETFKGSHSLQVEYAYSHPNGNVSGPVNTDVISKERLKEAEQAWRRLPFGWTEWPHLI
ncbi:DUF6226 family protein [Timonella sp. A28]|uniref:DUF6226 family protein n=1 Tax=Timonella sp. A28 TaxID=3442640 RepID=UPI003EB80F2C